MFFSTLSMAKAGGQYGWGSAGLYICRRSSEMRQLKKIKLQMAEKKFYHGHTGTTLKTKCMVDHSDYN